MNSKQTHFNKLPFGLAHSVSLFHPFTLPKRNPFTLQPTLLNYITPIALQKKTIMSRSMFKDILDMFLCQPTIRQQALDSHRMVIVSTQVGYPGLYRFWAPGIPLPFGWTVAFNHWPTPFNPYVDPYNGGFHQAIQVPVPVDVYGWRWVQMI